MDWTDVVMPWQPRRAKGSKKWNPQQSPSFPTVVMGVILGGSIFLDPLEGPAGWSFFNLEMLLGMRPADDHVVHNLDRQCSTRKSTSSNSRFRA